MNLAYKLGKTEAEIFQLSPDEFGRWVSFFKILEEQEEKARRKSGVGTKSGPGGRFGNKPR